jgi:hypothetical protein
VAVEGKEMEKQMKCRRPQKRPKGKATQANGQQQEGTNGVGPSLQLLFSSLLFFFFFTPDQKKPWSFHFGSGLPKRGRSTISLAIEDVAGTSKQTSSCWRVNAFEANNSVLDGVIEKKSWADERVSCRGFEEERNEARKSDVDLGTIEEKKGVTCEKGGRK